MKDLENMKIKFDEQVDKLKSKKAKNHQLFTKDEYYSFLDKVKTSQDKMSHKTPDDYQRLATYDIVKFENIERLIVPVNDEKEPVIYYTFLEEVFEIIHQTHISVEHGGRNKMMKELKIKYKNITAELVMIYLHLCKFCRNKTPKKEPAKPRSKVNKGGKLKSVGQIDLIDMQSQADGEFKFIMVYEDYLTKFVQLRALKTESAEEIAHHLLDVFAIFGAPCTLQSNHGQEFARKIIGEVSKRWDELNIFHATKLGPGSVKTANHDVGKVLSTWLETNKTKKWSQGIRFVQFMTNRAYNSGIRSNPNEATFGFRVVGLKTSN